MESLVIKPTNLTPSVHLDYTEGKIEIKGCSNPENSIQFYKPVMEWVESYIADPPESTVINIQLEHFNTSSSKIFLDMLKKLEVVKKAGKEILINWYYEEDDEDMMESGETYASLVKIPFRITGY